MNHKNSEFIGEIIKRISSNCIRARQAEQDKDIARELQAHLWVMRDIQQLLSQWCPGDHSVGNDTAISYAESAEHVAARIQELVAARVEYEQNEGRKMDE